MSEELEVKLCKWLSTNYHLKDELNDFLGDHAKLDELIVALDELVGLLKEVKREKEATEKENQAVKG